MLLITLYARADWLLTSYYKLELNVFYQNFLSNSVVLSNLKYYKPILM